MHYSISSERKRQRLFFDNHIEANYLDWQINTNLYDEFNNYKETYSAKNDVIFLNTSYFDFLCEKFTNEYLSLKDFVSSFSHSNIYIDLKNRIYNERYVKYDDYYWMEYPSANEDEIEKLINEQINQEFESFDIYLEEIKAKNNLILEEFKSFILGFPIYLQSINSKDYHDFKYVYNILAEDMKFFKNTKIKSLDKYKFLIGSYFEKHSEARGRSNDFIPAGICHYGSHVFMNSVDANKDKFGSIWYKKSTKQTFYHEIGHALDYLYFNESVLKGKGKQDRSSHNPDLLQCSKLNYRRFKIIAPQLKKKTVEWISYYCQPKITKKVKLLENNQIVNLPENIFSSKIKDDVWNLFMDFSRDLTKQNNIKPNTLKKFSPKININNTEHDYSRVLDETWSECFAFLFDWMKNGFGEYDKYTLKIGRSNDRIFIKIHYHSFMYILDNFDWEKLNISYNLYLKRRVQIKKFLNYVNKMPLVLNDKNPLEFKRKKYLRFIDILKG